MASIFETFQRISVLAPLSHLLLQRVELSCVSSFCSSGCRCKRDTQCTYTGTHRQVRMEGSIRACSSNRLSASHGHLTGASDVHVCVKISSCVVLIPRGL
ncbi:hypothetical protein GE09DRAFT_1103400, partial [Coniochaeta sp. 2T2.1]